MKVKEIAQILEEQSPASYALAWDNVGLLAGDPDQEVKKIYLALDATDETVEEAAGMKADLLVTHHPLIFSGMKRITADDFVGRRLLRLIQNGISYYAMHTNFDIKGMAELSAAMIGLSDVRVLDVTASFDGREEGIGRVGLLSLPMTLECCAQFIKSVFSLPSVRFFGNPDRLLTRAAICPGSGKSEIGNAISHGADVLITGDIGHHDGIDALAQGLCIIDAGHYGLEHIFIRYMEKYLMNRCSGLEIAAQKIRFPFSDLIT